MPATYTYNDGIDDAKAAIVAVVDEVIKPLDAAASEHYVLLLLAMGRRLEQLKRPTRAKRSKPPHSP
jgi:hypothetical protein